MGTGPYVLRGQSAHFNPCVNNTGPRGEEKGMLAGQKDGVRDLW